MYEVPTLTEIGSAKDLICGFILFGDDPDTQSITNGLEFQDDDAD